jgi:hypothetical protein
MWSFIVIVILYYNCFKKTIFMTFYYNFSMKYHKTACTSLPEDEHLDVRDMSKTL